MKEKHTIMVLDKDGQEKEAEILLNFNLPNTGKEYIIYTFNEKDDKDMLKIYVSILIEKDGMFTFENIESDEEWALIKEVMKSLAQQPNE